MANDPPDDAAGIVVRTEFVRHRNALLARARLTDLYLDHHLHLAGFALQVDAGHNRIFQDLLAAFVLHCASRPRNEMIAWTLNLQEPRLNLFATADNATGDVAGRVFTENVKEGETNLFYVETVRGRDPVRRSVADFTGADVFKGAEAFYERSEQRPARFFDLGDEEYALLSSHPDCDLPWLRAVTVEQLRGLAETETLVPIELRRYAWRCGCNEQRMFQILAPAMRDDPEGLFGGEDVLRMQCPRCGARYRIGREALEAFVARAGED